MIPMSTEVSEITAPKLTFWCYWGIFFSLLRRDLSVQIQCSHPMGAKITQDEYLCVSKLMIKFCFVVFPKKIQKNLITQIGQWHHTPPMILCVLVSKVASLLKLFTGAWMTEMSNPAWVVAYNFHAWNHLHNFRVFQPIIVSSSENSLHYYLCNFEVGPCESCNFHKVPETCEFCFLPEI